LTQALAVIADVYAHGLSLVACGNVSVQDQQSMLDARNAYAESKLRGRYKFPLISWGVDLRMAIGQMTAYDIICRRGFNPAAPGDVNYKLRHDDAVKWLDGVERQNTHPAIVDSAAPEPQYQAPAVLTGTRRGW
jgi:hypothetical protein